MVRLGAVVPATAGGGWEAGPATVGSAACNACNHGQRGLQPWAAERGLQPRVISRLKGAVLTAFVRTAFDLPSAYIGLATYRTRAQRVGKVVTMSERTAFPTHYSLSTTDYSLLNTYYLQPATYYSLLTAYRLPPTTHYLLCALAWTEERFHRAVTLRRSPASFGPRRPAFISGSCSG